MLEADTIKRCIKKIGGKQTMNVLEKLWNVANINYKSFVFEKSFSETLIEGIALIGSVIKILDTYFHLVNYQDSVKYKAAVTPNPYKRRRFY